MTKPTAQNRRANVPIKHIRHGGATVLSSSGGNYLGRAPSLADPASAGAVEDLRREITRSPEAAREFLRSIGIVNARGRLTKTYGGA